MRYIFASILSLVLFFSISLNPSHALTCHQTASPPSVDSIIQSLAKLQSGQTLCLKGGTYTSNKTINVTKPNITIIAAPGETPILDGKKVWPPNEEGGITPYDAPIKITSDNVTLEGITVKNVRGRGIQVVQTSGVVLRNNTIDWAGRQGISFIVNKNGLVEGNSVYNTVTIDWNGAALQIKHSQNIEVSHNIIGDSGRGGLISTINKNINFHHNIVHNIPVLALYIERTDTMNIDSNTLFNLGSQSTASMITVKDEWCRTCGHGNEKYNYMSENISVTNNIVVVSEDSNYALNFGLGSVRKGEYIPDAGLRNIKIANNTLIGGKSAVVRFEDHPNTPSSLHSPSFFTNNILIKGSGKLIDAGTSKAISKMDFSNNIFSHEPDKLIKDKSVNSISTSNIGLVNPITKINKVEDFRAENYQLTPSSPAINAGKSISYVSRDYFLAKRPHGSAYDIGFHEFGGEPGPTNTPGPTQPTSQWDLNQDNNIDILDFSYLLFDFASEYSFPDLSLFSSALN